MVMVISTSPLATGESQSHLHLRPWETQDPEQLGTAMLLHLAGNCQRDLSIEVCLRLLCVVSI